METPFNGKVNIKLIVKLFDKKNKILFNLREENGTYKTIPCYLSKSSIINFPFINFLDDKFRKVSYGTDWNRLFETQQECDDIAKKYNNILNSFRHRPYIGVEFLSKNFIALKNCEKTIDKLLSNFENYDGIDFCNVGANGIQIRLHHNKIKNYTYATQYTIKYDLSNIDEAPIEVAKIWLKNDTQEKLNKQLDFIKCGEKYGWN